MAWRELITDIYSNRTPNPRFDSKPVFCAGVSNKTVAEAETRLKATFPDSLRLLLQETDGVLELMKTNGSG
jgi:cell wall assembly regulator SMI1